MTGLAPFGNDRTPINAESRPRVDRSDLEIPFGVVGASREQFENPDLHLRDNPAEATSEGTRA